MKRFVTILCVALTLMSTLTVTSFANSKGNEKTENPEIVKTLPVEVSQKTVLERIDELDKALGGKYFTVNQKSCGAESSHGCSNCGMLNVVDTEWFQETVGFSPINRDWYPHHYFMGQKYTWGMSCCGFAVYAGWYIYAQKETDRVVYNSKGTHFFNEKNAARYLEPGDILRLDGKHSVVFISYNEDGIVVLDCNWRTDGTNCEVRKHLIEYSSYSLMGVSRALNHPGESELSVKIVNPDYPKENVVIPFEKGEKVSLMDVDVSKIGHYQVGWYQKTKTAKKTKTSTVKYSLDAEIDKSVTLYPLWKEYDNQRLVVIGTQNAPSVALFGVQKDVSLEILGEIPVGTQENWCEIVFSTGGLTQKQIDKCVKGNKEDKKYIIAVVLGSADGKVKIIDTYYSDEFDYGAFLGPKTQKNSITKIF